LTFSRYRAKLWSRVRMALLESLGKISPVGISWATREGEQKDEIHDFQ